MEQPSNVYWWFSLAPMSSPERPANQTAHPRLYATMTTRV